MYAQRGVAILTFVARYVSWYLHYRLPRFGAIPAEQRGDITTMCVLVSTCDMCHTVTRIKGTFKCVRSIQKRQCTRKLRMASFSSFHLSSYKITVNVDILRLVSLCFYHSRVHIPAHNKLYKPPIFLDQNYFLFKPKLESSSHIWDQKLPPTRVAFHSADSFKNQIQCPQFRVSFLGKLSKSLLDQRPNCRLGLAPSQERFGKIPS